MYEVYQNYGVTFRYPGDWEVIEGAQGQEVSIQVQSPASSFWSLSLLLDCPAPADVMETVLGAFRDEYEELDDYAARATLCEQPTLARDIDFVCRELINSAWIRIFRSGTFTALVLYQSTFHELDEVREAFEEMCSSLVCEEHDAADEEEENPRLESL